MKQPKVYRNKVHVKTEFYKNNIRHNLKCHSSKPWCQIYFANQVFLMAKIAQNRWFSRYVIAAMLVDGKQKIAH